MPEKSSLHYQDEYSSYCETSMRNEYMRFACMFYLFTLFAFLTTILLFLFANNSYHNESESIQRRFLPYSVLGSISLVLFCIFFIGSLVYTSKLIKKLRTKQTLNSQKSLPHSINNLPQTVKEKSIGSFIMNSDKPQYSKTKAQPEQKSQSFKASYHPCQTDV